MTNPVVPPPAPEVPVYPELGSANFNQQAYDYATAMPGVSVAIEGMTQAAYTNALSSKESAQSAASSAVDAAQVSAIALGAANFKGNWPDLSGPLPMPASVKHAGRFWLLTEDLPDVAAAEPGVSAAWTSLDSGQVVTQQITANTQGIAGVKYLIAGPNVTLTAPTAWNKGDQFAFVLCTAVSGNQHVAFGTTKINGRTPGTLDLNVATAAGSFQFEDPTIGLILA